MFDFLKWFTRITARLEGIHQMLVLILADQTRHSINLRRIMADLNQMQADLTEAKTSLSEIRTDLNAVRTISDTHKATIATLEAQVADLRQQLTDAGANTETLNAMQASIADLKTEARSIADIVSTAPPPTAEAAMPRA